MYSPLEEDESSGTKSVGASRIPMKHHELAFRPILESAQLTVPWNKIPSIGGGSVIGPGDGECGVDLDREIWSRLCIDGGNQRGNRRNKRVFHVGQCLSFPKMEVGEEGR